MSEIVYAQQEDGWPLCSVPDCENKECIWCNTGLCSPCSIKALGEVEYNKRYEATRVDYPTDLRWNGRPYIR